MPGFYTEIQAGLISHSDLAWEAILEKHVYLVGMSTTIMFIVCCTFENYIFDKNISAIMETKRIWNNELCNPRQKINEKNNIIVIKKLNDIPKLIDVLILSTTADVRESLILEILKIKNIKINNWILEKPIVQSLSELNNLDRAFFKLKNIKPSHGGEIHITDAIQELINENKKFIAHNFSGKYLDCGSMKGYIKSSKEISKI